MKYSLKPINSNEVIKTIDATSYHQAQQWFVETKKLKLEAFSRLYEVIKRES